MVAHNILVVQPLAPQSEPRNSWVAQIVSFIINRKSNNTVKSLLLVLHLCSLGSYLSFSSGLCLTEVLCIYGKIRASGHFVVSVMRHAFHPYHLLLLCSRGLFFGLCCSRKYPYPHPLQTDFWFDPLPLQKFQVSSVLKSFGF